MFCPYCGNEMEERGGVVHVTIYYCNECEIYWAHVVNEDGVFLEIVSEENINAYLGI